MMIMDMVVDTAEGEASEDESSLDLAKLPDQQDRWLDFLAHSLRGFLTLEGEEAEDTMITISESRLSRDFYIL